MIRPFTCLTLLFAAGSGLYLYTAKHKVELLDRDIARLEKTAQDSRARASLLHAQYDLLGDPERLRELATQVLTLQPTDPKQFTTMAELDRRLPPPGPLPQPIAPAPVAQVAPQETAPAPERQPDRAAERPVSDKAPERPAEKPADKLADKPGDRPVAVAAPRPAARVPSPLPAPAPVIASATPARPQAPTPQPRPIPAPAAAPGAAPAPRRAAEPQGASLATAEPASRPLRGTPVDATVPMVASALGMARAMLVQPLPTTAQAVRR